MSRQGVIDAFDDGGNVLQATSVASETCDDGVRLRRAAVEPRSDTVDIRGVRTPDGA